MKDEAHCVPKAEVTITVTWSITVGFEVTPGMLNKVIGFELEVGGVSTLP